MVDENVDCSRIGVRNLTRLLYYESGADESRR
jgi:hypothetical protein